MKPNNKPKKKECNHKWSVGTITHQPLVSSWLVVVACTKCFKIKVKYTNAQQ